MTIREAIEWGLLTTEQREQDKAPRVLTNDKTFVVWYDRRHLKPYRYARARWANDGAAGQHHGGEHSLEAAMQATVRMRENGVNRP